MENISCEYSPQPEHDQSKYIGSSSAIFEAESLKKTSHKN